MTFHLEDSFLFGAESMPVGKVSSDVIAVQDKNQTASTVTMAQQANNNGTSTTEQPADGNNKKDCKKDQKSKTVNDKVGNLVADESRHGLLIEQDDQEEGFHSGQRKSPPPKDSLQGQAGAKPCTQTQRPPSGNGQPGNGNGNGNGNRGSNDDAEEL